VYPKIIFAAAAAEREGNMAEGKLILCVCGAGINTSLNAKNKISEYLASKGRSDVQVIHAMIGDIGPYKGRSNMVIVWMTQMDESYGAPGFKGLPFMIGSKKAKEELAGKIVEKLDEISVS